MLSLNIHRSDLRRRLDTVRAILDATQPGAGQGGIEISREARGLSILLLYASYEHLLKNVCRSLLEEAQRLRVGNKRLKPGLRLIAAHPQLQGLSASTATGIWKTGLGVVVALADSKECTISPNTFPNDGSNFKRSQVRTFCDVFDLGDPAVVLKEVWERLDTIVTERNRIAHGQATPDVIGRSYSENELRTLVGLWELRWGEFVDWVELAASSRSFFRMPR